MLATFLNRLLELKRPETVEIDGRNYSTSKLFAATEPEIETITVHTLTGLIDYIKENRDELNPAKLMIQIVSPTEVKLLSGTFGQFKQREHLITAKASPAPFNFGRFIGLEEFIIGLQACFVESANRAAVLELVSGVTESATVSYGDDGVSQQVETRQGIALRRQAPVPNPVELVPYRTFREIEQVPSAFVFRLRSAIKEKGIEPGAALHEADGGAWNLEAIQRISAYLKEQLPGVAVLA